MPKSPGRRSNPTPGSYRPHVAQADGLPSSQPSGFLFTISTASSSFPDPIDPDVVYLENMASALFLEDPGDISRYVQVFDYLRAAALSPQATRAMLMHAAEEFT